MNLIEQGFRELARSLREFGYPDANANMVSEVYDAMREGKSGTDLPHGVIGRFAENHIRKYPEIFPLPDASHDCV